MEENHFKVIYATQAARYERMVAREDMRGNLFAALMDIVPLNGLDVVEFGAGTGRMTRLLGVTVRQVYAFDGSAHMLAEAARVLSQTGMTNWTLAQADNRALPVRSGCADLAIQGWSFSSAIGWFPDSWPAEVDRMLGEMQRVLRPGGTAVLIETMGTGSKTPQPPHEGLAALYRQFEGHGFHYRWIRTDYQFASVEEADELTRFFFGDELADRIVREGITILPECTGIWWRRFD